MYEREILLTGFKGLGGLLSHFIERNAPGWLVSVFNEKCYIVSFGSNVWEVFRIETPFKKRPPRINIIPN